MPKLIIKHMEVGAKKLGGEQQLRTEKGEKYMEDIPRSIEVSVELELVTTGDFSEYWDDLGRLKREVFEEVFGRYMVENRFYITVGGDK